MTLGGHSSSFTHVLYHLGMTLLAVAAIYAVIFLVLRPLLRSGRVGGRRGKTRWAGGPNRQQRRQERAMARRKRRY